MACAPPTSTRPEPARSAPVKWATRSRQPYKLARMLRVGIVGWRGMVGSVLVQRMREERDFDHFEPVFFSTSQAGGKGPSIGKDTAPVKDAKNLAELKALPVIISCQGGDYTNEGHAQLRKAGWKGTLNDPPGPLSIKDSAV